MSRTQTVSPLAGGIWIFHAVAAVFIITTFYAALIGCFSMALLLLGVLSVENIRGRLYGYGLRRLHI